jgi:antitoxin (DNA-binding transcriptional repressor) of toxin-antitoxin stability system
MNPLTLDEARDHLGELCEEARQGKRVLLAHGTQMYAIVPFDPELEPNWDDPELETALLVAVEGPHRNLSLVALRERGEQVITQSAL